MARRTLASAHGRRPKGLYPADWPEISRRVKEAAGWRCQHCGARHGAWVTRDRRGRPIEHDPAKMAALGHGKPPFRLRLSRGGYVRVVGVVLACAHLDGAVLNMDPANLAALCQRCHLAHDLRQHTRNAAATRRRGMGTLDLF